MNLFIDTSAIYVLFDKDDANHNKARKAWADILGFENTIMTTNYVLVECFALLQHRLGPDAARGFQEDVLPVITVEWIKETTHHAAASALLAASKRKLSLVDCVSFETMRTLGIKTVFAFDAHFRDQGFICIP